MIPLSGFMAVTATDVSFWERIAEKWGIGFVGLALFVALAYWTTKREERIQDKRDERDERMSAERLAMQTEIRDLNRAQLDVVSKHANKLEAIIKDGNKAQADVAIELKNIARLIHRPERVKNNELESSSRLS